MTRHPTFTSTTPAAPTTGHEPGPARGRRLGRSLAAGLLIAASLTVAACGKEDTKTATILNTEKVERAIEHSVLAQRAKKATVSCPSGVHQKQGITFSCTATVKRVDTKFVVTQQDGAGRVRYEAR
jgi:hypothetical protein